MTNSRQKGARGEREAAKHLTKIGYPAERSARSGVRGAGDLICERLWDIHIEIKRGEAFDVGTELLSRAMQQAIGDAGEQFPVVLWRRNRGSWRVTFTLGGVMMTTESAPQSWAMIEAMAMARRRRIPTWPSTTSVAGNTPVQVSLRA